ncbi:MAG: hypothetical protein ABSD20_17515 [Terriglobales bacterium]|jgi:hypothetical protein
MIDYVYPSIFFAYLMFFLFLAGAIFFLIRSRHDGYWGSDSEEPAYRMMADDDGDLKSNREKDEGRVREAIHG